MDTFLAGYVMKDPKENGHGIYGEKRFATYDDAEAFLTKKAGHDNDADHLHLIFQAVAHIEVATLPVTITKL